MPTTRAILTQLTRDELLGVLDAYDLRVSDRRVKNQLLDALAASPDVQGEDDQLNERRALAEVVATSILSYGLAATASQQEAVSPHAHV